MTPEQALIRDIAVSVLIVFPLGVMAIMAAEGNPLAVLLGCGHHEVVHHERVALMRIERCRLRGRHKGPHRFTPGWAP